MRLVAWRSAAVLARWECEGRAAGLVREGGVGAGGDLGLDGWVVGLMGCGVGRGYGYMGWFVDDFYYTYLLFCDLYPFESMQLSSAQLPFFKN